MTYTTIICSLIMSTLPLTAFAKDVKGISRAKLCAEGYKVGCPEDQDIGNVTGDGQQKDDPAKAQNEYGENDKIDFGAKAKRQAAEKKAAQEQADDLGEDEL